MSENKTLRGAFKEYHFRKRCNTSGRQSDRANTNSAAQVRCRKL